MANNQFMKMRHHIEKIVGNYNTVLDNCITNDKWHSETINRMAYPYLNGCFTLAVIGNMSSGKSTFINTFIGLNILPTGHFQTTSAITYIEHGDKASMNVKFADDHEEYFEGNKIKEILRDLVALPEEYKDLPINDINLLISGGDTLEDILAKKEGIEKKVHLKCNVDLWKKYVESHPKSSIASEVQCLRYGVDPFILDDKRRTAYYRGIARWDEDSSVLMETVLQAQARFQNQMETCMLMEYCRPANPRKL